MSIYYRSTMSFLPVAALCLILVTLTACSGEIGGNTAPTADDDVYNGVNEGSTLNINAASGVLNGDTDGEGDSLTAVLATGPANASSFTLNADGSFTYVHDSSETTSDSFTYRAQDSKGANSNLATVSIGINPMNDPPVANDDTYTVSLSGATINISASGVLGNDTDPEGPPPTNAILVAGPTHDLSFALNPDGSFSYTNDGGSDACGGLLCDSFTYYANDGSDNSTNPATVTLIINRPPVADTACVSTTVAYTAGSSFGGTLPGSDLDGGALVYDIIPNNDSLKGLAITDITGNFTYTPLDAGVLGMDRFTYTVTDDQGVPTTGTAWVFVGGTGNSPPAAVRIMPVGDSITDGVTDSGANQPPAGQHVGYRRQLYDDLFSLANSKYAVDFVGQLSEGASAAPPVDDPDNQGTPGQQDDELATNISGYLNANQADILLMHIGTNAFTTNASDVADILTNIDTWEGTNYPATVFLARIIDDVPGYGTELDVTTFNTNVDTMVGARPSDRVLMVDMRGGALLDYGDSTLSADMADNLHPNQTGYDKMASKWYVDLTNPANVGAKYLGLPQCP